MWIAWVSDPNGQIQSNIDASTVSQCSIQKRFILPHERLILQTLQSVSVQIRNPLAAALGDDGESDDDNEDADENV